MKKCINCENNLNDTAKFCVKCGTKQEVNNASQDFTVTTHNHSDEIAPIKYQGKNSDISFQSSKAKKEISLSLAFSILALLGVIFIFILRLFPSIFPGYAQFNNGTHGSGYIEIQRSMQFYALSFLQSTFYPFIFLGIIFGAKEKRECTIQGKKKRKAIIGIVLGSIALAIYTFLLVYALVPLFYEV